LATLLEADEPEVEEAAAEPVAVPEEELLAASVAAAEPDMEAEATAPVALAIPEEISPLISLTAWETWLLTASTAVDWATAPEAVGEAPWAETAATRRAATAKNFILNGGIETKKV